MGAGQPHTGVWDQVLAFGQYQHATIDGAPVLTVFDASTCAAMLDDFAAHPESDIFYDKQHEIVDDLGDEAMDRAALKQWGDGHALAWANALAMVVGGKVVRYEAHAGAPPQPPSPEAITRLSNGQDRGDGVYALRCTVTPRGADPKDGLPVFRYTSPYFVPEKDGWRLLNLTATNDPRMRGAALAMGRDGVRIAMQRTAPGPMERDMDENKEMMARAGCMESDTPAAQIEKMAAYIRKMEDEQKKKDQVFGDLEIQHKDAMGRIQKMESDAEAIKEAMRSQKMDVDPSNWAQNAAVHIKTGNSHDGKGDTPIKSKYLEREHQAMQRELDTAKAKLAILEPLAGEVKALREAVAMERGKREAVEQAEQTKVAREKAEQAIAMGRVKPDHKGDVPKTLAWLTERYAKDAAATDDMLAPEGTFQPSERIAMTRMTEGGRGIGQPAPQSVTPVEAWAQKIDAVKAEDPKRTFEAAERIAMQRFPREYQAYVNNPTMARV